MGCTMKQNSAHWPKTSKPRELHNRAECLLHGTARELQSGTKSRAPISKFASTEPSHYIKLRKLTIYQSLICSCDRFAKSLFKNKKFGRGWNRTVDKFNADRYSWHENKNSVIQNQQKQLNGLRQLIYKSIKL